MDGIVDVMHCELGAVQSQYENDEYSIIVLILRVGDY